MLYPSGTDRMTANDYPRIKMPQFRGHVKVTLRNVHNHKTEVIEGSNIVTHAVRDLLSANYLGAVDYSKIFGSDGLWKKWFGGVLCYQNPHPTIEVGGEQVLDPDNYFPVADSVNHLVAHAGQTAVDPNHDDDLRRGNPTSAAFVFTKDSVKQVWEWGTTHGNGTISALSLTHADTGDAGLGSNSYAFQNFVPFERLDSFAPITYTLKALIFAPYNESNGLAFAIGNDGEWYGGYPNGHQAFETNKLTIYVRKFPFSKAGLYHTLIPHTNVGVAGGSSVSIETKVTVTLPWNVYAMPCYYFDYTNKKLWIFTNVSAIDTGTFSKTDIKWARIDLSDLTSVSVEASGTIVSDTANLAPLGWGNNGWNYGRGISNFSAIVFDGTSFYFPTGTRTPIAYTGYQRINFSNQADQSTIVFNTSVADYPPSPVCAGGLLVSDGRVTNGNVGYSCGTILNYGTGEYATMRPSWVFSQPNKVSSYIMNADGASVNASESTENWDRRFILASKLVHSTLYNLPTPVTKSASQAMTVEYTLIEEDA